MSKKQDFETIRQLHEELLIQYKELRKKILAKWNQDLDSDKNHFQLSSELRTNIPSLIERFYKEYQRAPFGNHEPVVDSLLDSLIEQENKIFNYSKKYL